MGDQLRINGIGISWSSAKLKLFGERITGISSIAFSDALETAFAYGMGRGHKPVAQSAGKYAAEQITLKARRGTGKYIRDTLAARGDGVSFGDVVFPMILQYIEEDEDPVTIEFEDCRYVGTSVSDEEGPELLTDEIKISTFGIKWDGKTLYRSRR